MASPILVTGAAGRVGGVGRTVTELLLKQGKAVRAMVRTDAERAQERRQKRRECLGMLAFNKLQTEVRNVIC